jgi:post-segregation antitoxin (ccd killing protein)
MMSGMSSAMVKTSVTVPEDDLREAKRLRISLSQLLRDALRERLREERLDREIDGYAAAFAEWDESEWDHLAGDGLASDT